jgi:hypothetical protein
MMNKDKINEIKIGHPKFGHVIFYGVTPRQIEVLESLKNACIITDDVITQNKMLAGIILEKHKEVEELETEIKKLKSVRETPYIDFLN